MQRNANKSKYFHRTLYSNTVIKKCLYIYTEHIMNYDKYTVTLFLYMVV